MVSQQRLSGEVARSVEVAITNGLHDVVLADRDA